MYNLWPKQAQFMTILSFDLQAWPWPLTIPEQMFQMALLLLKKKHCAKLFWNAAINVEVMARTNQDRHMHTGMHYACTNIHSPNWSCDNYVPLTARQKSA